MKTLLASTAENVKQFEIHLNDTNPSILARNILVLKIISAPDFNPEKDEDVYFLWDIWYNATWPETTRKKFLGVLKDLVNGKLPQNVIIPEGSHLQSVKKVWSSWRKTLTENHLESTTLIQKICIERYIQSISLKLLGLQGYPIIILFSFVFQGSIHVDRMEH